MLVGAEGAPAETRCQPAPSGAVKPDSGQRLVGPPEREVLGEFPEASWLVLGLGHEGLPRRAQSRALWRHVSLAPADFRGELPGRVLAVGLAGDRPVSGLDNADEPVEGRLVREEVQAIRLWDREVFQCREVAVGCRELRDHDVSQAQLREPALIPGLELGAIGWTRRRDDDWSSRNVFQRPRNAQDATELTDPTHHPAVLTRLVHCGQPDVS